MVVQISGPFDILMNQPLKPCLQLLKAPGLLKPADFFCLYVTVGNLDADGFQLILGAVKPAVAQSLCQVDRIRFFQPGYIHIDALNLINGDSGRLGDDSVRSSLHQDIKHVLLYLMPQHHFGTVGGSHTFLNLPVQPAAGLHGLLLGPCRPPVVQIPASHYKLHQVPHRNAYLGLRMIPQLFLPPLSTPYMI